MALRVLAANALLDIATLKDEHDLGGNVHDQRIIRVINVISSAIRTYCRRDFEKATVTEDYPPSGTPRLVLKRTPLLSLGEIQYNGGTLDPSQYEIEDAAAGIIRLLYDVWQPIDLVVPGSPTQDGIPGTSRKLVSVTYTAGYVLPKDATDQNPQTLPGDVEQAALLSASRLMWSMGRNPQLVSEPDEADVNQRRAIFQYRSPNQITGVGQGGIIPDEAVVMLRPYRRSVF